MSASCKALLFCVTVIGLFLLPESGASEGCFDQAKAITLPSNDFLVNDGMATGIQTLPAIATNQSDYFVIVWQDERNGWGNEDIYGQLYNLTGVPIGTNFKVNTDEESRAQLSPSVAMDGSGNFIVVWEDDRNGDLDVYAQRFSNA